MKKNLLLMAMALFAWTGVYAQEEGGEEEPTPEVVFTKSFQSVIDDAKFIVGSDHYTEGKAALQSAIGDAEAAILTFEHLMNNPRQRNLLNYIDVLVDGPFVKSQRDETLCFRGSRNQRLVDVPQSIAKGKTVTYNL